MNLETSHMCSTTRQLLCSRCQNDIFKVYSRPKEKPFITPRIEMVCLKCGFPAMYIPMATND